MWYKQGSPDKQPRTPPQPWGLLLTRRESTAWRGGPDCKLHLSAGATELSTTVASTTQRNQSRLTAQRSQDFQQVLRVPRGALAASLDGSFVGDLAYQIEREVANSGHILGAAAGAQA